jgi:hypothetical protein
MRGFLIFPHVFLDAFLHVTLLCCVRGVLLHKTKDRCVSISALVVRPLVVTLSLYSLRFYWFLGCDFGRVYILGHLL